MQSEKIAIRDGLYSTDSSPLTLVELLQSRASEGADRQAYIFLAADQTAEISLTYGELDRQARAIAAFLQTLDAAGERVLLLYPPGLDYIAAFFGCLYAGAIAVPAYPPRVNANFQRLRSVMEDSQASIALTSPQIQSRVEPLLAEKSFLNSLKWFTTESLSPDLAAQWRRPPVGADTIAFLQYTSGSTTTPKGVVVTHQNLLHNQGLIRQAFGQSAQSVILSWLPFYHDMGLIGGVLQPLFLGAKCVLMSPTAFLQRPLRWLEAISAHRATTSGGPNFAYDLCVDKTTAEERAALDLSSWNVAFNGAEPVRAETLSRFAAAFEPCGFRREAFYPCYGLAEATLLVSGGHVGSAPTIKNVAAALVANRAASATAHGAGRHIVGSGLLPPQQKVVIADPHDATICAPGEVGEIWVSGQSVAKGYWRAREDTDAFNAYVSNTGEGPFLRTGDLGFIENGELFVTGRLKDLIIIRGVNYYPQDIELTVERSHAALRKGAGAAFSVEAGGQERLVVVQELDVRAKPDANEVIDSIRRAVAEAHELQIYAVALIRPNSIPKTSSGKIQRYACRERFLNDGLKVVAFDKEAEGLATAPEKIEFVSPATTARDVESFLISHIAARLKVDPHTISASDPVTRYGFDSLMSIELTHEVEKALGIVMPMTCFLGSPTIADIAAQAIAQLAEALPDAPATLAPAPDTNEYHPLSYGQQALWFLHQLEPTSPAYNIASALRIVSGIDSQAIRRALQGLIDRHPMLRATFSVREGKPVQFIHQNVQVYLLEDDAESWGTAYLNERLTELAALPFNLEQGPLFRVYLFARSPREHVLLLVVHHLVADFWSLEVLIHELSLLYSAETDNAAVRLPALPLRYTDYVRWQTEMLAGEEGERLWNYWQQQLGADLPPLDLPLDKPRPPVQSFRGASESLVLDESLLRSLKALAQTGETTLFAVLLTAFQLFLHRYTGQEQIVVGTPTSGRSRAELANIAGYFVNPVAIKSDFKEGRDFRELLALNRKTLLGAYQHEEYPFALLVERLQPTRHAGRSPLFQVMFVLQKAHLRDRQELAALALGETGVRVKLGELELETIALQQQTVQFDLTLLAAEIGEGLVLSMQYNVDLFESTTIRRALANYQTLLEGIVENPHQRLADLPIVSAAEQEEMVRVWNDTRESFPSASCLHHLIETQARLTPEAVALRWRGQRLTYAQLDARAALLARRLRRLGARPDSVVALCLDRTPEMLVAMLGTLKAGAAYLPLDPAYPRQRLAFMLDDAGAAVLIAEGKYGGLFPDFRGTLLRPGAEWDEAAAPAADTDSDADADTRGAVEPRNLAYLIYTSGSTGRPKGVAIEHHSAVAFLWWARRRFTAEELGGVLASTSVCFDLSVFELFAPLSCGGCVILADDALALPGLEAAGEVRLINTVPSAMAELVRQRAVGPGVLTVNLAGEALHNSLAQEVYATTGVARVLNLYGPSEDTTYSTCAEVERGATGAPAIGRPISNGRVYVLDRRMRVVPVGVTGEIYVAGEGVARGYWQRPELTAERFVPDPYGAAAGGRMYRTGDVGRYGRGGEVEYLGREDQQVKVRGYRIELGEIEEVLSGHEGVEQAAVVVREREGGDKRLVGYVVGEAGLRGSELRRYVRERLPEYMVPSEVVQLAEMPLTANGKVDRAALPAAWAGGAEGEEPGRGFEEACGEIEEIVAGIYAQVLGAERVGRDGDFFELGGHSLLAAQAASRIGEVFRIELALRRVFESPSVAQLSAFIEQELRAENIQEEERIERVSREKDLELSYGQQQLWLLEQLGVDAGTYNISAAAQLRGELHLSVLQESFNEIVRRHEALRTTYTDIHGRPVQQIAPELKVELTLEDLTRLDQKEREREVKGIAKQEANRRFDLRRGPLLHVRLLRTKEQEHVLILTMHHIVSDGWSIGIIMKELSELYSAHLEEREASLEELEIQYPDYAAWQRERLGSDSLNQQMEYWRKHLAGELPVLELPTDHPRPAVQSYRGASEHVRIGKELRDYLRKLGRRENATLYMILMAAYKVLLHKYTGQQDVIVGTPVAGRTNRQVKNLIGFFVNMLVMRTEVKDDESFLELLKKEREVALNAYANQEVPFEKLVEELRPNVDLSRSPIFQVAFNMLNFPTVKTELPGLTLDTFLPLEAEAKFDITLYAGEQPDGALQLDLIYNVDLFTRERMAQMLEQFVGLLTQIVEDSERPVSHLSLVTPSAEKLLPDPRQPIAPEWEGTVHQALSRQAHRVANRQAIRHARGAWTYQELDYFSNQLSHYLYGNGVRRGDIVAIYADRSPSLVWAILGILKAGAAFAILDSAYSASRLIRYVEAVKPRAWIQIKEAGLLPVALENHVAASPLQCRIELSWETAKSALKDYPGSDLNISVDADDLAYVAFTSGSTGRPKVILGTHRPLAHFLKWHTETFALHESDRFSLFSGISHDPVLRDIFTPLWLGATLCIPAPEVMRLPGMLADWLRQEAISVAHMTPPLVQLLGEAGAGQTAGSHTPARLQSLRYVFLAGDVATRRDVSTLRSLASGVRCVNFYGTTETPQAMGYFVIHESPDEEGAGGTNAKETIPIGRGIDGVQLLLLTPANLLAGVGEIGEICVRTPYLSKGYLDDETPTRERFIANPFRDEETDRIYRTADSGRYLPDGNVEFLGRMDRQLKIRGFRIELEEIEQPLSRHPDVRNCVVVSRADKSGLKRLIAYLVTDGETVPTARELRNFLKDQLPEHMIPAAFVQVEKLPLTANGKIDYRALPAPDDNAFALNTNYVPPRTELERNLTEIWKRLLEVERISIHDNFFELGGHSILATQCLSQVREVFQVEIPLLSLFQEPTFINLAERIYAAQLEGRQTSLPPITRVSREVE